MLDGPPRAAAVLAGALVIPGRGVCASGVGPSFVADLPRGGS